MFRLLGARERLDVIIGKVTYFEFIDSRSAVGMKREAMGPPMPVVCSVA